MLAGRLQNFYHVWEKLTSNSTVLSWIQGYKIPLLSVPHQKKFVTTRQFSSSDFALMHQAIQELLSLGAVVPCSPTEGQYISKFFLADKPNGKKRFILNLKEFNYFVCCPHFKMEDFRTVLKLIRKGCFMSTLDLKDAYFLVSVHTEHRKYLRFLFDNALFEFTCLPFGLSSAPFCFTKLMKPVLKELRSQGIICVNYLDDFLFLGDSYDECQKSVNTALNLLDSLGLKINLSKSSLVPRTKQQFLGFIYDSLTLLVILPENKKLHIQHLAYKLSSRSVCTIRELAVFLGLLTSACPAIKYGWLYTKQLEREKYLALLKENNNYDALVRLSHDAINDLAWWQRNILTSYNDIKQSNFRLEIFTDSSLTGWGACCGEEKTHGFWSPTEKNNHINYLELRAIFYGLKCFACDLRDCRILIRADNTTAISYVNKMGSIRFPQLNLLARDIWQWCELRNIFLFASYINSKSNLQADAESRVVEEDTEWALSHEAFATIQRNLGPPDVDLFASSINKKCSTYVSWRRDPGSLAIDAFTLKWTDLNFYAFPPFCLILRVIQKIVQDKAEGILVVPDWPAQPWYPLITKYKTGNPIIFKPDRNLLSSPFRSTHPMHRELSLVAVKLSAKVF